MLRQIVETLIDFYNFRFENTRVYQLVTSLTSFEFLVLLVLNQNTSDVLADRAFENLAKLCGRPLTPEKLLSLGLNKIVDAVRVSGMYYRKAKTLIDLSKKVLQVGEDFLDNASIQDVRQLLLSVHGFGEKSTDVFLLFKRSYPTFPVDTHIKRICARLGIENSLSYAKLRERFLRELGPDVKLLRDGHLVLIQHGKTLCRARSPRCSECPIREVCKTSGRAAKS